MQFIYSIFISQIFINIVIFGRLIPGSLPAHQSDDIFTSHILFFVRNEMLLHFLTDFSDFLLRLVQSG